MNVRTGFLLHTVAGCLALGACIPGNKAEDNNPPPKADLPPPLPLSPELTQVRMSEKPPVPVSGGTLRILSDQRIAVASDPDRDKIFVVDVTSRTATPRTIDLQAGDEPGRVVEDANGRVHVVLRRGGAIVTLAAGNFALVGRRQVCPAPRGLAFDARTDRLHVACAGGEFVSLTSDPNIQEPIQTTRLDVDLRDVVVVKDRIFVSRFRSAEVLTLDANLKVIERRTPGSVQDFNAKVRPQGTTSLKTSTAGNFGEIQPSVLWRMQVLRSGEVLALHQAAGPEEVSTSPGGYGASRSPCGGGGGLVQTVVSRVGDGSRGRGVSLQGSVAVDLAVSPDETRAVVVANGNAHSTNKQPQVIAMPLSMMDSGGCMRAAGQTPPGRPRAVDGGPGDPAPTNADDGDLPAETFELRTTIGEATSVGFARRGHVVVQTREPATLQVLTAGREYTIALSKDSRFDTGHALFHSAPGFSGLACASCHPEGGDDGRIWTFEKIGARRTQTLRGGILATAPFHWDGALRDMGHLMTEVFESRMRGPTLSDKHVEALGRFLDKVPLVPPSKPQDEPAAERGRALFARQNCATCHLAGHTDNKTVNVGTGGGMQTPSLRGVVMRAPFMHNGCAGTLKDRFNPECGGGDKHGLTSRLTPEQISDLVAFMESL